MFHPLQNSRADFIARVLTKSAATGIHLPSDPKEAKQRLVKDSVDFTVWDGEPEILDEDCLTYYVVSLTYEAQRGQGPA